MKKIIFFTGQFIIFSIYQLQAQNVGIGTTEPLNKLHIAGNLLVNTPVTSTSTAPTIAQTKTMVNASTISFAASDSTGRIYDPGGPSGNYIPNLLANASIVSSTNVGIEVTAETMDLNTGDSLIIKESLSGAILLTVGNGYTTTGKWVFNSSSLYIIFKSNADANTGIGFSLLFKRLYNNSASLPDVSGITGSALFFDTKTGSFRSGLINNDARGIYSTAMGNNTTASGSSSIAVGESTTASGFRSTAMGYSTIANGTVSTALGQNTIAFGNYSTAMGQNTNAVGDVSTAMGYNTDASGTVSTAMGDNTTANGIRSTAMGQNTIAFGNYSTAMGASTTANGNYSTAMGKYTDATGYAATAIGDSSLASGSFSLAGGFRTTASGDHSTAMGDNTTASGYISTAMGVNTIASGQNSTVMGFGTTASGFASTAMGNGTIASGDNSTATGYVTIASGYISTAMGSFASTNNQIGSFVIGDNSTLTVMNSPAPNNFRARFANGYKLYTSANYSTACSLNAGDNAWTTGSDVRTKENFAEVDGEGFLKKIAGFHLTTWNYKTQNPKTFRHYGPMAQDFYAAFGKDKYGTIGNDTTINSADFAGVSFIAIQALETRTAVQQQELEQNVNSLKKEIEASKAIIQNQQKQIGALKVLINKLTSNIVAK